MKKISALKGDVVMNAPTFWQQVLIAVLAIFLMPTVIAILAKLHILPITVYLLIADSFPGLIEDHRKLCNILIAVFIAYPALIWGRKLLQLWREERDARKYLLASAVPIEPELDMQGPQDDWTYTDDDMDW